MKTVYDLIRHRATLEVICGNCDNSRVFNHRFLMSQFGGGQTLAALKFVCRRRGARRYRLRIVADSLGEQEPLKIQHFGGVTFLQQFNTTGAIIILISSRSRPTISERG
jgi:hypothetical protein